MGGHGGLNILPQKSWNVYGRENRLKVAQDEAQHAEEEKIRMDKQREAESQARRLHLLQQAAKKRGEHFQMPQIAAGPEPAQQSAPSETQSSAAVEDSATAVAVKGEEAQPALLQHINFFAEHEARESHPEKLEEAKREARRRGDKKTQTSDAKFDEKFQVGHGLSGEANKPWYAKSSFMLQPEEAAQLQGSAAPALPAQQHIGAMLGNSSAGFSQAALPASSTGLSEKHRLKADKAARKEEKRRKQAEKAAHKHKHRDKSQKKGLDIERLRKERSEREKAERERARQAVLGNARAEGVIGNGKRYHGAYGNRAAQEAGMV